MIGVGDGTGVGGARVAFGRAVEVGTRVIVGGMVALAAESCALVGVALGRASPLVRRPAANAPATSPSTTMLSSRGWLRANHDESGGRWRGVLFRDIA